MRQLANLPNENLAERFAAYLVTQGITAHSEPEDDGWAIWVREENQLEQARQELEQFQQNPNDTRFEGVHRKAESIRKKEAKERERARKKMVDMRSRWKDGVPRHNPLTRALIFISIGVTLLGSAGLFGNTGLVLTIREQLYFVNALNPPETALGNILQGQVWRLVTPIFPHADPLAGGLGILHIVFNMYWLHRFGSEMETREGTVRFGGIVLLTAVISNMAQALFPADLGGSLIFGGMSGVVFALFGFIWMKSHLAPNSGYHVDQVLVMILLGFFFLCFFLPGIANIAHAGGLISGMVLGSLGTWRAAGQR